VAIELRFAAFVATLALAAAGFLGLAVGYYLWHRSSQPTAIQRAPGDLYAGLTQSEAAAMAKKEAVTEITAFTSYPASAIKRTMDQTVATKATCGGQPYWRFAISGAGSGLYVSLADGVGLCRSNSFSAGLLSLDSDRTSAGPDAAGADVRAIIPSVEAYFADNGTYAGMTVAELRKDYDNAIDRSTYRLRAATATTYCIEATVGSSTMHKSGPAASIVPGPCP
jgi:hypothetical protein